MENWEHFKTTVSTTKSRLVVEHKMYIAAVFFLFLTNEYPADKKEPKRNATNTNHPIDWTGFLSTPNRSVALKLYNNIATTFVTHPAVSDSLLDASDKNWNRQTVQNYLTKEPYGSPIRLFIANSMARYTNQNASSPTAASSGEPDATNSPVVEEVLGDLSQFSQPFVSNLRTQIEEINSKNRVKCQAQRQSARLKKKEEDSATEKKKEDNSRDTNGRKRKRSRSRRGTDTQKEASKNASNNNKVDGTPPQATAATAENATKNDSDDEMLRTLKMYFERQDTRFRMQAYYGNVAYKFSMAPTNGDGELTKTECTTLASLIEKINVPGQIVHDKHVHEPPISSSPTNDKALQNLTQVRNARSKSPTQVY